MSLTIRTHDLLRQYESYKKEEGLWNSVKGLWGREYVSKTALQPTTLEIFSGSIVGLVGANGAGKTTLLKLLAGLIYPTSGEIEVLGFKPSERKRDFLKRMSILLGQKNQLWWDIPPLDSYNLLGRIYDIDPADVKIRVDELAHLLACEEQLTTQLRRLSLGERMKMEIIGSLLHRPDVIFLDEPTIGLDVVAQSTIREFLASYVKKFQPTIILTSHYMDDITQLSDRLLLISKGQIVYDGSVQHFTQKTKSTQRLQVRLSEPLEHDFVIQNQTFAKGVRDIHLDVEIRQLGSVISRLATTYTIHDIKIEEADFEEIIHNFLSSESRPL